MRNLYSSLVLKDDVRGIARVNGAKITIFGDMRTRTAVKELSKYGLVTFSRETCFKSTNYTIHFLKPVKKLKQLYNLGDEVLILCCNDGFKDFKSRTKDFLDYLLITNSEFRNRLDKITCFLFDDYADIVDLVKDDRLDHPDSRLIVPFSYEEAINGISEDMLQSRLRTFLYERDLFGIASPLRDDNLFFGKDRTNIISELYGKYRQGEHGGLFGLRRIGKTSILNLLKLRVEQVGGVAVYFDCTKYHHLRWNRFLLQIVRDICEQYKFVQNSDARAQLPQDFKLDLSEARYSDSEASLSFESDLKRLYVAFRSQRILLIFDEIEQISFGTSASEHWKTQNDSLFFWQSIRSISQSDNKLFSFVITGVNPKCVEDRLINGNDNPIFNILTPQYVQLFSYDDIKSMISSIGAHLGLSFEEEIYTKIMDDYGGHPFLTRQVCSIINNDILKDGKVRPYTVSKYQYDKKTEEYRVKMESVVIQILGVLEDHYPNEYELLKILSLDGSAAFSKKLVRGEGTISHLLGYCLIKKDDNDYFIKIKSVRDYIREKYKYDITTSDMSDKRAQITRRRGAIEEKLRNLIRSQMNIKFGKKALDQLITKLNGSTQDKTQTSKLRSSNLQSAMKLLYFYQLKILICKDWVSYQAIFNDKVKFEQFFDIINNFRIDAHAGDIDSEDEAVLNIAFKFFEAALIEW